MRGKKIPFLQGETYYASREGLPDPIWEQIGGWEPHILDLNGYCASILLQEVMEAAAQLPTRMGVEPPEQHEQLETIAGTKSGHNIQAAQESKEYQHTKNNLTMLETLQLSLLAATSYPLLAHQNGGRYSGPPRDHYLSESSLAHTE